MTLAAQADRQQGGREVPLLRRHFLECDAFPLLRNEVPIETLVVFHREHAGRLLLRRQRRNQIVGGDRHFVGGKLLVATSPPGKCREDANGKTHVSYAALHGYLTCRRPEFVG